MATRRRKVRRDRTIPRDLEARFARGELTVIQATRGLGGARVLTVQFSRRRSFRRIEFRGEVWWERLFRPAALSVPSK